MYLEFIADFDGIAKNTCEFNLHFLFLNIHTWPFVHLDSAMSQHLKIVVWLTVATLIIFFYVEHEKLSKISDDVTNIRNENAEHKK